MLRWAGAVSAADLRAAAAFALLRAAAAYQLSSSRVRSIGYCCAECGRGQPRADGRRDNVPTRCSVLYLHTKQPVPDH